MKKSYIIKKNKTGYYNVMVLSAITGRYNTLDTFKRLEEAENYLKVFAK